MKVSSFSELDTLQLIKDSIINIEAEYDKWIEKKREAAKKSFKVYKTLKERKIKKINSQRRGE